MNWMIYEIMQYEKRNRKVGSPDSKVNFLKLYFRAVWCVLGGSLFLSTLFLSGDSIDLLSKPIWSESSLLFCHLMGYSLIQNNEGFYWKRHIHFVGIQKDKGWWEPDGVCSLITVQWPSCPQADHPYFMYFKARRIPKITMKASANKRFKMLGCSN